MSTNWDELANQYKVGDFKPYAPVGEYTAKVKDVVVDKTPKGTHYMRAEFEQTEEYQFPKSAQHWLSRNNINWCKWHHMNLMQVLGASEEAAKSAIDKVEITNAPVEKVMEGYKKMYQALAEKHVSVRIRVREQYDQNGNVRTGKNGEPYLEAEFADSRVFIDNKPKEEKKPANEIMEGAEEATDIDLDSIPF